MKRIVQNTWHANVRAFGDIFKAGMGQQLAPLLLRSESLLTVEKNSGASKGHFQRVLIIHYYRKSSFAIIIQVEVHKSSTHAPCSW